MIYVIMGFIDLIIIGSYKSNLDSKMNEVVVLYKNNRENEINAYLNKDLKNVVYSSKIDGKYTYLYAKMDYDFVTPGLDNLIRKMYEIEGVSRVERAMD